MKMSKKEKTVLTKTQKRSLFRWFLNGGASLNYERMMSMAYTYSMLPWLKENYKGNPEGLKKSVKTHLQYYNCSPYMNPYVMGVNMGIEGQGKENSLDAVMAIKTGLMGPLSGLGDCNTMDNIWSNCCQYGIKRKCSWNFHLDSCNMDFKGTRISVI